MGYEVRMTRSTFTMDLDDLPFAFTAVEEAHEAGKLKSRWGYSFFGNDWMNKVSTMWGVFDALEFEAGARKGKLSIYGWNQGRLGDEKAFFETIASWVDDGSSIIWVGEDGEAWVWIFNYGEMHSYDLEELVDHFVSRVID